MSLAEYKIHFGEHTQMGPKGVIVLSKVQHPLRDAPLDELGLGQFRNLASQCRKKTSTLGGIYGGSATSRALVIANLAAQSNCPVVIVTKEYFKSCDLGDLPRLFAELASHTAILLFEQGDDLLNDEAPRHHHHIDKDALLKLITLRQGLTIFSLYSDTVIAAMKLRSDNIVEIATS